MVLRFRGFLSTKLGGLLEAIVSACLLCLLDGRDGAWTGAGTVFFGYAVGYICLPNALSMRLGSGNSLEEKNLGFIHV